MRFRKGNQYKFGRDFAFYTGLPAGVDFTVSRVPDRPDAFHLTAPGYGIHGSIESYGCGAIYVYGVDMRQKRRFVEATKKGKP